MKHLLIHGSGGFGREVAWLSSNCLIDGKSISTVTFVDDIHSGKLLNQIPIINTTDASTKFPNYLSVIAIGSPSIREKVANKLLNFEMTTLIHNKTQMSRYVDIDKGTIICAGNIITVNIKIGKHVHINLDCTIGHDVSIGDFTTISPGVHISGRVIIGKRVFIGTGAVIINGNENDPIIIDDDAKIGAGACVTKSIPKMETWVGIPAHPIIKS